MIQIDGHTFDQSKLLGGWVIDAGCRGFNFSRYCLERSKVYALDIENFTDLPMVGQHFSKFVFKQAALTSHSGETEAYFFGDGTGNFIKGINGVPYNGPDRPCKTEVVPCITLNDIYSEIGTDIDLLKLDIEGAEYEILVDIEPIPKQITVEFHEHCHEHLHKQYIDRILNHLCKHYRCYLNVFEPRYKYLDCLFIRKDLI